MDFLDYLEYVKSIAKENNIDISELDNSSKSSNDIIVKIMLKIITVMEDRRILDQIKIELTPPNERTVNPHSIKSYRKNREYNWGKPRGKEVW